jgi:hypothetical protein
MTTITENSTTSLRAAPEESPWHRSSAVGGIAFVVLSVTSFLLPGAPPASDASAARVAAYFKDHAGGIKAQNLIGGLAIIALVWWFGGVWHLISRAEHDHPRFGVVGAISLGIGLTLAIVGGVFASTAAIRVESIGEGTQLLWTLSVVAFAGSSIGMSTFLGSMCVFNFRARVLPAWTNYLGALGALAFLGGTSGMATDANLTSVLNNAGFLLWSAWILTVSVVMWQRADTTR